MKIITISIFSAVLMLIAGSLYSQEPKPIFRRISTFEHNASPDWIVVSPDGQYAIIGLHEVELWSLSDGILVDGFEDKSGDLHEIEWAPDSQWVMFASVNQSRTPMTRIWLRDVESGEIEHLWEYDEPLYDLNWHPDSTRIVTALHSEIRMFYPDGSFEYVDNRHYVGDLSPSHLEFSPDGRFLFAVDFDRTYLWDANTYEQFDWHIELCGECVGPWAWSPDRHTVLLANIGLLNLVEQQFSTLGEFAQGYSVHRVVYSPNGEWILSYPDELYHVSNQEITSLPSCRSIRRVYWTPDSRYLVQDACQESNAISILDVESKTWDIALSLEASTASMSMSSNGILAVVLEDNTVHVFEYLP